MLNERSRGTGTQNRERRVAGKKMTFEIKQQLETGRPAGEPPQY